MRALFRRLAVLGAGLLSACETAPVPPAVPSTPLLLWNESRARPQMLAGELFASTDGPEATARAFLSSRAEEFHLTERGASLELFATRQGLAGTYLRFAQRQSIADLVLPVFEAEIVVLVREEGERRVVRAVNLEHREGASAVKDEGDMGAFLAIAGALKALDAVAPFEAEPQANRGIYVTSAGRARLAWEVKVQTQEPPHAWTLYLDAASGTELGRRDGVRYVDGVATIFDMNPVASTGDTSLMDSNDATSARLDAAQFLVTLPRLDGSGFTRGAFADTRTRDAGARVHSSANEFLFSRDVPGFEQANAYFHLDRAQARIQALGFTNVNNRVQVAIVNAHNQDNSHYSDGNKSLNFGRGGVDDAEDGDIVLHEYGHSIQYNQVPNFGGGDEDAMGEGFGDYLAASFSLSLTADAGHPQLGDPACVGDWDGTAYSTDRPPCLRRVDSKKHYPEGATNGSHDDGEMWSSALWDARGQVGGDVMDRLVLEGHFLMGPTSTFFMASQALLTADLNVNGGAHSVVLRRRLIDHGVSRLLTAPAASGPTTSLAVSIGPVRDALSNYRSNTDETRTLRVPGALGLILHFTLIDLETHTSCLQMNCDNIYLTNAAGDLFQVLSGARQSVSSAAVVGDTVHIRLVSDGSQVGLGYHVDRVDVLGAPDAGFIYDGGIDVFDAGMPPIDGGVPDAGPPDAGIRDAGIRDAGMPDAGGPDDAGAGDAGTSADAGGGSLVLSAVSEDLSPRLERGCGCSGANGQEAWLVLLGLWRVWARRRSRLNRDSERVSGRGLTEPGSRSGWQ